jgi:CDP-diacylglycerol---serine O-phosphatidyltransferase
MKHFSLIRGFHAADLFTIANGACGTLAVFQAMRIVETHDRESLYAAAVLVPLALIFDFLDGRVARWRHSASAMGRELDSLADVISFGIAPAAIAYAAGLNTVLDRLVLVYFVLCGLSRLARYNVTAESLADDAGKVKYFEGMPIPTSVVPLAILLLAFRAGSLYPLSLGRFELHLVSLVFLVSGSLMISKTVHIPKP